MRRSQALAFLTLMMTMLWPSTSISQDAGVNGHGLHIAAQDGDPRDTVIIQRPGIVYAGEFYAAALMEFAKGSLTEVRLPADGSDATQSPRLDNIWAAHLAGGVAVHDRIRLDLGVPLFFASSGRNGQAQGGGLGDLRFAVMTSILRPEGDQGFGLAAIPFVDFPTGSSRKFLGQGSFGGGLKLSAGYALSRFTVTGEVGIDLNGPRTVRNLTNPHALTAGLGLGFLATDDIGINAEFVMAAQLAKSSAAFAPSGTESPMEAVLSVRGKTPLGIHWIAGGSAGLSRGVGAAQFRVFAGGGFGKIKGETASAAVSDDQDNDGVPNDSDKCPTEPETVNDYKDEDGCPDQLGQLFLRALHFNNPVADVDVVVTGQAGATVVKTQLQPVELNDLVPGTYDMRTLSSSYEGNVQVRIKGGENRVELEIYPTEPGTLNIFALDGANNPVPTGKVTIAAQGGGEGITLELDGAGAASASLAPGGYTVYIQAESYGIYRKDLSIQSGSDRELRAVLEAPRAEVTNDKIEIKEKIYFTIDSAIIENRSAPLLHEIAALLLRNQSIRLVEIAGFTSSEGSSEYNMTLSEERAQAVVNHLVGLGVAERKLNPVGYGETQPLTENESEEGRAQNRRVEFNILKRK